MELERDEAVEIAVALLAVGVFIVGLVLVGVAFNDDGLSVQGGYALVASIVLFVAVMTAVGYWLSARET